MRAIFSHCMFIRVPLVPKSGTGSPGQFLGLHVIPSAGLFSKDEPGWHWTVFCSRWFLRNHTKTKMPQCPVTLSVFAVSKVLEMWCFHNLGWGHDPSTKCSWKVSRGLKTGAKTRRNSANPCARCGILQPKDVVFQCWAWKSVGLLSPQAYQALYWFEMIWDGCLLMVLANERWSTCSRARLESGRLHDPSCIQIPLWTCQTKRALAVVLQ